MRRAARGSRGETDLVTWQTLAEFSGQDQKNEEPL
jgi:hypothetical protein